MVFYTKYPSGSLELMGVLAALQLITQTSTCMHCPQKRDFLWSQCLNSLSSARLISLGRYDDTHHHPGNKPGPGVSILLGICFCFVNLGFMHLLWQCIKREERFNQTGFPFYFPKGKWGHASVKRSRRLYVWAQLYTITHRINNIRYCFCSLTSQSIKYF